MEPRPLSATDRYGAARSASPRAGWTGGVAAALAAVVLAHSERVTVPLNASERRGPSIS